MMTYMKRLTLFAITVMLALGAASLPAADLNGTWVAQVPGRDGNTIETTFTFKSEGETLTGTMSNQYGDREISEGKVSGDNVSFNVHLEFGGNNVTMAFTGKAAGNEIKFKRERKGGDVGPASVEFVAKKK